MAAIAFLAGGAGSVALTVYAGRNAPPSLIPLFAIWVAAPFVALWMVQRFWPRWSMTATTILDFAMVILAVASLSIYSRRAFWPGPSPNAFLFVLVPLVQWVVIAIVVPIAMLTSRRSSPERER